MAEQLHISRRAAKRGFTLVELLVSIAIVAMLLAVLLPALGRTIATARGFRCQMSQRSIAFDFSVFADDQLHGDRGFDTRELGKHKFRLETFQSSQYGVNEFWRWGTAVNSHTLPDANKNDPMRCSEVKGFLTLTRNQPCSTALAPASNISFTFNMRLHRAEVPGPDGQLRFVPVHLRSSILENPRVPLVWDVDGAQADQRGASPIFSAPGLGSSGPYAGDQYWYPAMRHNGALNIAFIDGSVSSSKQPLTEHGAQWDYQPAQ